MPAGKYRHRVLVQKPTAAASAYGKGAKAQTWAALTGDATSSTFWAFVRPLRAGEKVRASQPGLERAYVVQMRYTPLINSAHRLVWTFQEVEHTLEIVGDTNVDGRGVELELLCNEREVPVGA